MVGIVVVAHSAKMAEAVIELSQLMVHGKVRIAAAGGTADPENPFGTNAIEIQKAIEAVYSHDGVIVLMDMGSSILSAETALELLNEEQRAKVRLCEAPLVEGAISAVVSAGAGGTLEEVIAEARGALAAKVAQLKTEGHPLEKPAVPESVVSPRELSITIRNPLGLHARPAARFVSTVNQFKCQVYVRNVTRNTPAANARSINSIFTLGILQNHEVLISATGPDADQALKALQSLVERNFDEASNGAEVRSLAGSSNRRVKKNKLTGIPVAPGVAVGPVAHYLPSILEVAGKAGRAPEAEWQRLLDAISAVKQDIKSVQNSLTGRVNNYETAIFDSHILCLDDPALLENAGQNIFQQFQGAEAAWKDAVDRIINSYRMLDDPYLRSRCADLEDLKTQLMRRLAGNLPSNIELDKPSILVASELKPSEIACLGSDKILGICTSLGSANSHSAILSRALGVPVVFGLGKGITEIEEDTAVVVNGNEGSVLISPENRGLYEKQQKTWQRKIQSGLRAARRPAITSDGKRIEVMANIGSPAEARKALLYGAEGIGLLRTEFLFLDRTDAPEEEEQLNAYKDIFQSLAGFPVTIRTLDIGGDKILPYLPQKAEANPFLGERGIRFSLHNPDIFKIQLRAILRAGWGYKIRISFPMVTTVVEIRQAKAFLEEAKNELGRSSMDWCNDLEVGIMIEVPSAALLADRLAKEVNFFSIGTNDLIQYTMAADRNNAGVEVLGDAFHPAVLRLVRQSTAAGQAAGIPVTVCGEMAGQPSALPLLLGMGIDKISINLSSIAGVKQAISRLRISKANEIAAGALELDSGEEVKRYLAEMNLKGDR